MGALLSPRKYAIAVAFLTLSVIPLLFALSIASAAAPTSIDDSTQGSAENQFGYSGTGWQHCSNCGDSLFNTTKSWSSTAGDSVTITFSGTQLIRFFGELKPHG